MAVEVFQAPVASRCGAPFNPSQRLSSWTIQGSVAGPMARASGPVLPCGSLKVRLEGSHVANAAADG